MRVVIKMIAREPSQAVSALPASLSQDEAEGQFGPRLALGLCAHYYSCCRYSVG